MSRKVIITLAAIVVLLVGIWVLTNLQRAKKTQELLIHLVDPDDLAAMDAMDQLRHRGHSIGPRLIDLMTSEVPRVRYRTVMLLMSIGYRSPDARERVIVLLSDHDADVQRSAAEACGRLRITEAEGPLVRLLTDTKANPNLLAIACQSLGILHGKTGVPVLAAALKKHPPVEPKKPKEKDGGLAGPEKAPEAPKPGEKAKPAAPATPPKPKDKTWQFRMEAAYALGAIGDPAGVDALAESLRDDKEPKVDVRVAAAYALGDLGSSPRAGAAVERACLALLRGLADEAGDVRIAAAMSLARLYPPAEVMPQVEKALRDHMEDDHYWVRRAVKYTAHQLGVSAGG